MARGASGLSVVPPLRETPSSCTLTDLPHVGGQDKLDDFLPDDVLKLQELAYISVTG